MRFFQADVVHQTQVTSVGVWRGHRALEPPRVPLFPQCLGTPSPLMAFKSRHLLNEQRSEDQGAETSSPSPPWQLCVSSDKNHFILHR
ncbi:hypothetical protein GN956_G7187 [Arapaima gigas]